MLHDPREGMERNGVAAKLAKLNAQMEAEEATESKTKGKTK